VRRRTRHAGALALALALLAAGAPAAPGAGPPPGLASARALLARLRAAGRAEAQVRLTRHDPLSGRDVVVRGTLALERPGLARLDLADGQRLTLRGDGGDMLQPAAKQLVRAGPRSAAGLLSWWGALLDPEGRGFRERRVGPRAYELTREGASEEEAQRLTLGADGLPATLVAALGPDERVEYRLARWRFARARGRAGFVLQAPPGYEVVELP